MINVPTIRLCDDIFLVLSLNFMNFSINLCEECELATREFHVVMMNHRNQFISLFHRFVKTQYLMRFGMMHMFILSIYTELIFDQ